MTTFTTQDRQDAQRTPLTKEQIAELKYEYISFETFDEGEYGTEYNIYGVEEFARAIERAHGIGE